MNGDNTRGVTRRVTPTTVGELLFEDAAEAHVGDCTLRKEGHPPSAIEVWEESERLERVELSDHIDGPVTGASRAGLESLADRLNDAVARAHGELGENPPCDNCGYGGLMESDEAGDVCPECGGRP